MPHRVEMNPQEKQPEKQKKQIGAEKGIQLLWTRLAVIQTLYSEHISDYPHIQHYAWLDEEQHQQVDEEFYHKLLNATHDYDDAIMVILAIALDKRKWQNMDIIYQRLLICGCAELMAGLNDTALIISIYCRICDSFYDDKMGKFTNGVLQNCAQQIAGQSKKIKTSDDSA